MGNYYSNMKLGKQPAKFDARTLRLARYLEPGLPDPPKSVYNSRGVTSWGVLLNDRLGCCPISAVGHTCQVMVMSQIAQGVLARPIMPDDNTILAYYEQWCGYDPSNPNTDQGGVELDVLNKWRKSDFEGRKIKAFVSVDPHNSLDVMRSIQLFGGLYIGLALPFSAQNQDVWQLTNSAGGEPGSWGGHAVFVTDYNSKQLQCITWGEGKWMDWSFFQECCDEAYAILSDDWMSPDGFDEATLASDLALVSQ